MQRPRVREVADIGVEERCPAGGIDRLEDDRRAGAELVVRETQEPHELSRLKMLDDLDCRQASE